MLQSLAAARVVEWRFALRYAGSVVPREATTDGHARVVETVDRALDVLSVFERMQQPTVGVTEIAQELGLSKAVVHRLLTTLAAKGFVHADPATRRYALGPAVLSLGLAYLKHVDARRLALPVLQTLSAKTDETSTFSIRNGWHRVYVDQVTPSREVRVEVELGWPFPLHAGSSSKVFLAFLDAEEQKAYLRRGSLERVTKDTPTDVKALRAELVEIRERGYARSFAERQPGVASVAAPVFDHRGEPVAAISVCGPIERFRKRMESVAPLVVTATQELSRRLGHGDAVASAGA
jgi:DNA-binding IclR family transcriptional regulator